MTMPLEIPFKANQKVVRDFRWLNPRFIASQSRDQGGRGQKYVKTFANTIRANSAISPSWPNLGGGQINHVHGFKKLSEVQRQMIPTSSFTLDLKCLGGEV